MTRLLRKFFWPLLIILWTLLGAGAGLIFLSSQQVSTVSDGTLFNGLPIGGLSFEDARAILQKYYEDRTNEGVLLIDIDNKTTSLAYSEFDLTVDIDKTFKGMKKQLPGSKLDQFFNRTKSISGDPVFTYNSGKLLKKCEDLLSAYEKQPVPRSYAILDGVLKENEGASGRKVDYARLEIELKAKLFSKADEPYRIDTQNSPVFLKVQGETTGEAFTTIVSKSLIPVQQEYAAKVKNTIESVNGLLIDGNKEFDLKSHVDFSKFGDDMEKDLLNRIATGIYQSALPLDGVVVLNRRPSLRPVSFTEPGLEAVIEGEGANLSFRNETGKPLMLLTELTSDTLGFYIVSTGEIKAGTLKVERKDQVPPPVITSVNQTLSANETKVVSEGTPGFTAYVSRVMDNKPTELYHDKYQPVSKVVEAGEKPVNTSSK